MGQGASLPESDRLREVSSGHVGQDTTQRRRRRRSLSSGNIFQRLGEMGDSQRAASSEENGGLLSGQPQPRTPARSGSTHRLSRMLHSPSHDDAGPSRPSALQRSRTTLSHMFHGRRDEAASNRNREPRPHGILQQRSSYIRASARTEARSGFPPPRLPSIDQTSTFDRDIFGPAQEPEASQRSTSSHRLQNIRFNSLRPDRPFRSITSSFRRRRSPPPSPTRRPTGTEDQATMLSRLLSMAASATAATLMGDDHQALSEARELSGGTGYGDVGGAGEDGSFDGFLRALQNGRIASALRQSSDGHSEGNSGESTQAGALNFFRMFRFNSSRANGADAAQPGLRGQTAEDAAADGRMVPIIIVGIRSINPNSSTGSGSAVDELPPFIDALGNFPSPLPANALGAHGHDSIDSILRPPQNGTSFRSRRRASMGGFGMNRNRINDRYDDQRDHRSPDRRRERPWSIASSTSALEPRPPPATPASPSPELSRISSRNTTPSHSRPASFVANSLRDFSTDSRRNSALHRSATSPLSSHTEETVSLHSTRSSDNLLSSHSPRSPSPSFRNSHRRSDTAPNIHYPRFASGHPRRNGVVEPDNLPPLSRTSTSAADNEGEGRRSSTDSRSWIIYVLGGSYPENHPILTTPSLFTENPTYEDMMLLSALLGPAKAPVASEEDVQSAGGVYDIIVVEQEEDAAKTAELVAVATTALGADEPERVVLEQGQRCLVCLSDFEVKEIARRLAKCGHLYHRECIDTWLTQGRNSCPLCRGQGVNEKEKPAEGTEDAAAGASAETENDALDVDAVAA
nr:hypothetical protein B0A51_00588 [Rachicladosporium sp. CCFEE 5018]